jgi:2'-5' RNA ligase
MRVFLAIDIDEGLRRRLEALSRDLRSRMRRARWVRPEALHLTLRFFGEIPAETADALGGRLSEELAGLPAFSLEFYGCGVFPERRNPRVLWIGVRAPPEPLFELQRRAERAAIALGFEPEGRGYEPHLTVARFRGPERGIEAMLREYREIPLGSVAVTEATLYQSHLSPAGSRYEPLRRFPLGRAEPVG